MGHLLATLLRWLISKLALWLIIAFVLVVVFAVTTLPGKFVDYQQSQLEQSIARLEQLNSLTGELAARMAAVQSQVEAKKAELQATAKRLQQLDNLIRRLFFRRQLEDERRMLELKLALDRKALAELDQQKAQIVAEAAANDSERQLRAEQIALKRAQMEELDSMRQWGSNILKASLGPILLQAAGVLVALGLAWLLWKLVAYYVVAPSVGRARGVVLWQASDQQASIVASGHAPSQSLWLEPDETILVKQGYLQSSMQLLTKRTQWVFSWRYLFTSLATGLYGLIGATPCGQRQELTLSKADDGLLELAIVDVKPNAALVFRPRFVVAVIFDKQKRPRIVSRWVFGRLVSWVSLRFRYLLIEGPVKLVVAGKRGILCEEARGALGGRRMNAGVVVAYEPHLEYRPLRCETFFSYLFDHSPLFDESFHGVGRVLQQQVACTQAGGVLRFWSSLREGILKIFGL